MYVETSLSLTGEDPCDYSGTSLIKQNVTLTKIELLNTFVC
jgi:hypothetical protein